MRHLKKARKFGRVRKVRAGFLKGLAASFFMKGRIATTEARAKELRPYVERFLTRGQGGALADRRLLREAFSDEVTKKIIADAAVISGRAGGYTRITKLGLRKSDAARRAVLELIR
ncbi:MAG: 50S ribosomal protein L17 [bacterium]|nr:50S ribosomal protein L17 [bacterium]MDZ4299549.1 50S ribosomal protein L17 [Candidatus Sungbacteria bacterium]